MPRGVIKFYNDSRGYGFIHCDEVTETPGFASGVFVHYSQVEGLICPLEGQMVTFEIKNGDRGPEAVNVRLIS